MTMSTSTYHLGSKMKKIDFNVQQLIDSIFVLKGPDIDLLRKFKEIAKLWDGGTSEKDKPGCFVFNEDMLKIIEGLGSAGMDSLEKLCKYGLIEPLTIKRSDKDEALEFSVPLFLVRAMNGYSFTLDIDRINRVLYINDKTHELTGAYCTALAIAMQSILTGKTVDVSKTHQQNLIDFSVESSPFELMPFLRQITRATKEGSYPVYTATQEAYDHLNDWFYVRDLVERRINPAWVMPFSKKGHRIVGVTVTTPSGTYWMPKPFRHHNVVHVLTCEDKKVEDYIGRKADKKTRHEAMNGMQGFITADRQIVDRRRAAVIAAYYRQTYVKHNAVISDLYSEAVWMRSSKFHDPEMNYLFLCFQENTPELNELIRETDDKHCKACQVPPRTRYALLRHTCQDNKHINRFCEYN